MSCGIYKFQNLITKEAYIGQSVHLEERYKHHQREYLTGATKFYKNLQQWGWNNFSYEVIELCTKDELNAKEVYWIDFYDSFHNGYNETKGGSNKWSVDETQIQQLYDNGLSPKEIAQQLSISLSVVYKYLSYYPNFQQTQQNTIIFQYDLQGKFVQEWASRKEAARHLSIDATAIGKVISGERKSAGGFLWRNDYVDIIPQSQLPTLVAAQTVCQYDQNLQIVSYFPSAAAAAKAVQGDAALIRRVCRKGLQYSAYGYKWAFVDNQQEEETK